MGWIETIEGESIVVDATVGTGQTFYILNDVVIYGGGDFGFYVTTRDTVFTENTTTKFKINDVEQEVSEGENTFDLEDGDEIQWEVSVDADPSEITEPTTLVDIKINRYTGSGDCEFPINEQFSDAEDGYDGNWEIVETGALLTPTGGDLIVSGSGTASMTCNNLSVENTQVLLNSSVTGDGVATVTVKGVSGNNVAFHFLPASGQTYDSTNIDASALVGTDIRLRDYDTQLNGGITGIEVEMENSPSIVSIDEDGIIRLNLLSTGEEIWQADAGGSYVDVDAGIFEDRIYTLVGGKIRCHSLVDGSMLWEVASNGYFSRNTFDVNGGVYIRESVSGAEQYLKKYSKDGVLEWTKQAEFGSLANSSFSHFFDVDSFGVYVYTSWFETSTNHSDQMIKRYDFTGQLLWTIPSVYDGYGIVVMGHYYDRVGGMYLQNRPIANYNYAMMKIDSDGNNAFSVLLSEEPYSDFYAYLSQTSAIGELWGRRTSSPSGLVRFSKSTGRSELYINLATPDDIKLDQNNNLYILADNVSNSTLYKKDNAGNDIWSCDIDLEYYLWAVSPGGQTFIGSYYTGEILCVDADGTVLKTITTSSEVGIEFVGII